MHPEKLVAMQYRSARNIGDYGLFYQRELGLPRLQKAQCYGGRLK
jgi:hypothetical protein